MRNMTRYTVFTPSGDWRGIYAASPEDAKLKVARITFFRVKTADMTATKEES